MKKLNSLIIFSIILVLTSCRVEKKNDFTADIVEFENSELSGRWVQTNAIEDSEDSKKVMVSKIHLKDDFTAEIEVLDSMGYKTLPGNWEINEGQNFGPLSFRSDLVLTFDRNDHHRQIMSLSVKELNEKKILTSHNVKFEKE